MATFPIIAQPALTSDSDYYNFAKGSSANWSSDTPFSVNSWSELIASTNEDWSGFIFHSSSQYGGIISFAVGSAGNEVKIADIMKERYGVQTTIHIPIPVAAGSRLSIHHHCDANSSRTVYGTIIPQFKSDVVIDSPYTRLDSGPFQFPLNSGNWGSGTFIDPGEEPNNWSPWTEISQPTYTDNVLDGSSIPYQYKWLGVCFIPRLTDNAGNRSYNLEVAIGAPGSEITILSDIGIFKQGYTSVELYGAPIWIKWDRPPGDRISARIRSTTGIDGRRQGRVHLMGLL